MLLNPNGKLIIKNFLEKGSEQSMNDLIEFSKEFQLTYNEIAELTTGLAQSGQTLKIESSGPLCDIPSTGGPGSLSTLIAPLVLASLDAKVLKLGVPGRPAGGIDVLAQIKNYNIEPSINEIKEWIAKGKYIHVVANKNFTPLDIAFFNHRKKGNNLKIPSLVVASILAKKIALGIKSVGLDVRVSPFGNFGSTWEEARSNSKLFNNVASLLGINSRCFISNGFYPQQPYIGRGESLLALSQIFSGQEPEGLKKHLHHCISMGISLAGKNLEVNLSGKVLEAEFIENLKLQGGDYDNFLELANQIGLSHTYTFEAAKTGFVRLNLEKIRDAILSVQNQIKDVAYPDPCGIIFKKQSFEYVTKGDVICTYRCIQKYHTEFRENLKSCFEIVQVINQSNELEEII